MSAEARLTELGITLRAPAEPGGNYVLAKTVGPLVYVSGALSRDERGQLLTGRCGEAEGVDGGYNAARCCALTALSMLRHHLGSLDAVRSVVSVIGWVRCTDDFSAHAKVMNGASDLLLKIFGEAGRHTRTSVGATALPRGAMVEMQMIVEIAEP